VPNPVFHGSGPLRIPPGKHRVEFHYTGFNFDTPELIRFRYRVEGLEPVWTDAGTRRTAFYDYLPPGKYRIQAVPPTLGGIPPVAGALGALTPDWVIPAEPVTCTVGRQLASACGTCSSVARRLARWASNCGLVL